MTDSSEELPEGEMEEPELQFKSTREYLYPNLTVEPALLLLTFGITLSGPVLQNLVVTRACEVTLGYNTTVCLNLTEYPDVEAEIQPYAAILFMSKSLIEGCLPAALSFFIGPWSDHHGRRPLLLVPLLGHAVLYAAYIIFSMDFAWGWDPHWLLIASLPVALTGGFVAFITGAFCYITDISSPEKRAWRMGVAEAACLIGLPMGLASSSFVLQWGGYQTVFGLSTLVCLLGLVYVWFFLPESVMIPVQLGPPSQQRMSVLRSLLDSRLIKDMVKTCLKPRPGMRRGCMFLVMATLASSIFTLNGEISVVFLYTREKFHWTIKEYSLFSSATVIIATIGTLVGLHLLSTKLGLPDAPLAAFAFLTKAVSSTILALAPKPWVLFVGSACAVLGGLAAPLGRTILSKSVPREDIGKVFSLASSIDAITPIAAAPLYTLVYSQTYTTLPGAFFMLSAGIYILDVVCLCMVAVIHYKFPSDDYQELDTGITVN